MTDPSPAVGVGRDRLIEIVEGMRRTVALAEEHSGLIRCEYVADWIDQLSVVEESMIPAVGASVIAQPPDPIEALAAYAHEAWSGWMRYLFSKCGWSRAALLIPSEWEDRWKRQMNTPYAELREDEKESDRAEARKMLALMAAAIPSASSAPDPKP